MDEVARRITARHESGRSYSLVVVAEGTPGPDGLISSGVDSFGFERLGGAGTLVARTLEEMTGYEARVVTLGHLQRGGTPTAFDRVLATRLGLHAAGLAIDGRSGVMVAVDGMRMTEVDIFEACRAPRPLDTEVFRDARYFFA
jgi:6-phosphofructokinase 1